LLDETKRCTQQVLSLLLHFFAEGRFNDDNKGQAVDIQGSCIFMPPNIGGFCLDGLIEPFQKPV